MDPWTFGNEPLGDTAAAADVLRQVVGHLLAVEHSGPELQRAVELLRQAEQTLAAVAPTDTAPRVGPGLDSDGRSYIDHGRHIGAYNPCVPNYTISVDGPRAAGRVSFPIAYEGPPGLVHGGFLALFFDCVVQHHHCEVGQAGKTLSMTITYRRPTPLLTPLRFTIEREAGPERLRSRAHLLAGERLLCEAEVEAVAGQRANLPPVSPRRSGP